jgi:hypothetical protein
VSFEAVRAVKCDAAGADFAEVPRTHLASAVMAAPAHRNEFHHEWSDDDYAAVGLVHEDSGAVSGWKFFHVNLAVEYDRSRIAGLN